MSVAYYSSVAASSLLSSSSARPILENLNDSPFIFFMSLNLLRCIFPRGILYSFLFIFQVKLIPSDIYKKALRSSGNWKGEFSSSHLVMDISATPLLSVNSTSVIPIWFSKNPITFNDIISNISLTDYLLIFK